MVLEILIEDMRGDTPDETDLAKWANTYDLTMPVLSDEGYRAYSNFGGAAAGYIPYMVIIDEGVVITKLDGSERNWENLF
jgi:peroxiredoxin